MRRLAAQYVLFVLLAGFFLMRESRQEPCAVVDDWFTDMLMSSTRSESPPVPLALIEIDDASMGLDGSSGSDNAHAWPWPPLDYTLFLNAALGLNAPVIAIEPVLAWETIGNESETKRMEHGQYLRFLQSAILRVPRLLLGAELGFTEDPTAPRQYQPVATLRRVEGDRRFIPQFSIIEREAEETFRLSAANGFTNLPEQRKVRKVPMLFRVQGDVAPSFVLQAAMQWLQLTPDDVEVKVGKYVDLGGRLRIPIDREGLMRVDYRVPYERLGYGDLLLEVQKIEGVAAKPGKDTKRLREKLTVLVRADSEAKTLKLSNGNKGSRGQALAAGLATLLSGKFFTTMPWWSDFFIIGAVLMMCPWFLGWDRLGIWFFVVFLLLIYTLTALALFSATQIALPFFLPAGLLIFAGLYASSIPSQPIYPRESGE